MRILLAFLLCCVCWTGAIAQTLRPGDTIQISVYQDPKLDRQIIIDQSGMISFPLAGHIRAGGLTAQALEKALRNSLRDKYTSDLDITVSVVARNSEDDEYKPKFFVTGEVKVPGSYPLHTKMTVLQGLAVSGGLGPFAARKRIQIHRRVDGVESTFVFDYDGFEAGTILNDNIYLRAGDVIIVPERGLFE